jgi:hypothetical protein
MPSGGIRILSKPITPCAGGYTTPWRAALKGPVRYSSQLRNAAGARKGAVRVFKKLTTLETKKLFLTYDLGKKRNYRLYLLAFFLL